MKTMTMQTALKAARDGRIEFMADAVVGINSVYVRKADWSRVNIAIQITPDEKPVEVVGSVGMNNKPFRKIFKTNKALCAWLEKHEDATIDATREVE